MVQSNFETRVKIQEIVSNQIPEFVLEENPKFSEFLKQYYISQEYQGGTVDITDNISEYLHLDNLTPNVIAGSVSLTQSITELSDVIYVNNTKGFPNQYGLLQIDDEIITYKEKLSDRFIGCVRGFSGIESYENDLVFSSSQASEHANGSNVSNLSVLFLQKFYEKLKYTFLPGLEKVDLYSDLNVNNFIKNSRTLYQSKGSKESFRILFSALYGITPTIVDLETFLFATSNSEYKRRKELLFENLTPDKDPLLISNYTIRKNNDSSVFGSVSEAEIFTRNNKSYYKFSLFLGYDDSNTESSGDFLITPATKVINSILASESPTTLTVDSTVGFEESGSLFYNSIEIFYIEKSLNQFFGCYTKNKTYVDVDIEKTSTICSSGTYYGYENGDTTKRVNLRLMGVINDIALNASSDEDYIFSEGDEIYVQSLGRSISNPSQDKSDLEVFANSLIYNTSCRYEISGFNTDSNKVSTLSQIDDSSLKVGDYVEFLERNTEILVNSLSDVLVTEIDKQIGEIKFNSNLNSLNSLKDYDIRRKIKVASSSLVPIAYSDITSDVTNLYVEDDKNFYAASNSLPSYEINKNIFKYNVSSLGDYDDKVELKYRTIKFNDTISFLNGDKVYYSYTNNPILGLSEGYYYVTISSDKKEIKLYSSQSSISLDSYIYLGSESESLPSGTHTFTLASQKTEENVIYPNKLLKKFTSNPDIYVSDKDPIGTEGIGILVNGVEILSHKSENKIYYGPLEEVQVINSGLQYDVVNPPKLELSSGSAKLQPVVQGSIEKVYIDPQEFNIEKPIKIEVSGGNGKNVILSPVVKLKNREVFFDARILEEGGGIDISSETITFLTTHNFFNGQKIIYDINNINNQKIGVGTYGGSNLDSGSYLPNNASFYAEIINDKTVKIYPTFSDYTSGINTVGFTTIGTFGLHKFKTESKKVLDSVKVINGGEGFTNRNLIVKSSGISTYNHTINFKNHGFSTGEIVTYDYQTSAISGLSTSYHYYVLKVNGDSFRICNAGVAGTDNQNYLRENYIKFNSTGSGYQYFNYPQIEVNVSYILSSGQSFNPIVATPVVRGSIIQTYLYESGSDYGSDFIDIENSPNIKVLNGELAQITPIISSGKIVDVLISYYGSNYYSVPDLIVESGSGTGAILRAQVSDGKITSVIIHESGYSYDSKDTYVRVISSGKDAVLNAKIRPLTLNNSYKYGTQYSSYRDPSYEILYKNKENKLQYYISGYSQQLYGEVFKENVSKHSPIIGWSYDGIPIYGPFGYSDPENSSSVIKTIKSGYSLSTVENRVGTSKFPLGYFIDDYEFTNSGDLDEYNGRFCKTPEYPNGVYAYFATTELNSNSQYVGVFPYFIGKNYRSKVTKENIDSSINQSFDFDTSSLIRNTFPYKSGQKYATYDFFGDYENISNQICEVESTFSGNIEEINIIDSGNNYKIGDLIYFDSENDDGYGLQCSVESILGKKIENITSSIKLYENVKLYKNSQNQFYLKYQPNFDFQKNNKITISGLTTSYSYLNGDHEVSIPQFNTKLVDSIPYGNSGIVTDIYIDNFPPRVSIGSSIKIYGSSYDQYFKVLNYFDDIKVLRVKRSSSAGLSTVNSVLSFLSDVITSENKVLFESDPENYIKYFNPVYSVGVGTWSGTFVNKSFYNGKKIIDISIPTQSIYLPSHGFKTNQKILLKRPSSASGIQVTNLPGESPFNLLGAGETEREIYIINKSKDFIGLVTSVGLTTTGGLYFSSSENVGSNNYEYSFETVYNEVFCNVLNVTSTVSVSTYHNLLNDDEVSIDVIPQINVGLGNSTSVNLKYLKETNSIVTKTIKFTPSNVNIQVNKLNIVDHELSTGDKVYYISTSIISGLTTGFYYVYKIDSSNLNLCETRIDAINSPPKIVDLSTVGIGTQELNLIQSRINVVKNNNLVFNVSDSSLYGYDFKVYVDKNLTKEFVSTSSTSSTGSFSLVGLGTVGLSTESKITLTYSDNLPKTLYYTLEKNNELIDADDTVKDSLEIHFVNSFYSGTYKIFNAQDTTFDVYLKNIPEKSSYSFSECKTLKYSTKSLNSSGSVNKIKIIDKGSNYKYFPNFNNSNSILGEGLYAVPSSTNIGKINTISIKNIGFDYSSDKTLYPSIKSPKNIRIKSSNKLLNVNVIDGGKNYPSAPNLVIIDSNTKEKINRGLLVPTMSGDGLGNSNIQSVSISVPVNGLPPTPVTIKSVNNSNGIIIDRVQSSTAGILTCLIKTPILGFINDPFVVGDEVFLENIEVISNSGRGFNSENHGYQFFKVIDYLQNSNPGKITIQIPELYGNPGIAVTFQINTFASIVKKTNYPIFEAIQDYSLFFIDEKISIVQDSQIIVTDVVVKKSKKNYLNLIGDYKLKVGDIIKGSSSEYIATVENISESEGAFIIGAEKFKSLDWNDDSGKLSNDVQFIADNDYYQNLSYTIKSEKTWDEISPIVNSMVHPIGTKNFADTQISSSVSGILSTGLVPSSNVDSIQSFISKTRVDVIKDVDFVTDYDANSNTTRIIKFKNLKLISYQEVKTNRVLQIDDISREFSSTDDNDKKLDKIILELPKNQSFGRFLIQVKSLDRDANDNPINELQFTEIISLQDNQNVSFIEKSTVSNLYGINSGSNIFGTKIAEITPIIDETRNYYLTFSPVDSYNTDYDIKILSTQFLSVLDSDSSLKIGVSSIFNDVVVVPSDENKEIISLNSSKHSSFNSYIHIFNKNTNEMNYVEIYALYDGGDIYYSDFYFDKNKNDSFSYGFIGSFGLSISGGLISLKYYNNNETDNITVSSKTICFDDTASGIGTYRFKSTRQDDTSERTVIIESGKKTVSSSSTIFSYDSNLFSSVKSLVKIGIGSTISLHQLMVIHDKENSIITEYPNLSTKFNLGIGTFSSSVDENNFIVKFNPSQNFVGENVTISYYNEVFYTFLDEINSPLPLSVSPLLEKVSIAKYFGINSKSNNRLNFQLKYKNIPIFAKTFDPYDTDVLNKDTGIFTIDNHFFSTGEKLIYKPKSTFIGLGQSAMGIPEGSITDTGITTNRLPSSVYAIKLSNNQFKIGLTQSNANSGVGITFTYLGEGNAHVFEMSKKNEKSLITINNLAQYPLTYTGIAHSLFGNDGQIGVGNTFFTLSGISSVKPTDLIKIDDEYMKVLNVGIGTSNKGPILFFTGDKNIVEVERGFVGTSATSHLDNSRVFLYRGSYNVFEDEIYFTHPPRGSIFDLVAKDERNLERSRADFSGRVFLRKDYSTNVIFDDISSQFTGIGETFTLKSQGINTVGLGTTAGNGILFINGIYQTPLTENITDYNFKIVENQSLGISSVVFSGIRNDNDEITISESDVNQNQLPRGGIIVSLGSTAGLGYAPLVGANVRARLNSNGSIISVVSTATTGNSIPFSTVSYDTSTGVLNVFTSSIENLDGVNQVKLVGLAFTGPSGAGIVSYFPSHDNSLNIIGVGTTSFSVQVGTSTLPHYYVGYGTIYPWYEGLNIGSGYRSPVSVAVTEIGHIGSAATITANVGAGGTLSFNIIGMGTGYENPTIIIPPPNYQNLPIVGVSRLGIGPTTETGIGLLMNVEVGPAVGIDTLGTVGIGSTLYQVSSFKITRQGYNFRRGDIFKPVGLVTAGGLSNPIDEFKLLVLDTYNDNFASWQFGELNLMDSIKKFQNGSRLSYPLYYEGKLISFQTNIDDPDSQLIDFDSLLVIFINGILQEPKIAYEFNGGSLVRFLTPPKENDNVEIYFYVGTRNVDSQRVDVNETIKIGDTVQIYSNNANLSNTTTQDTRTVFDLLSSNLMETNLYSGSGIDENNQKPLYWIKQKQDLIINDIVYSKSRDSLEPQVYPTAKVIKNFSSSDTEIFVDDSNLFDYEEDLPTERIDLLVIPSERSIEVGIVTALVSSAGTISSLSIVDSGIGYTGSSVSIKISNPYYGIGVGIGSTATATISVSNGSLTNAVVINPGSGYTSTNPPQVIVENPKEFNEEVSGGNVVVGFNGVITGIGTTVGIGTDLALQFKLYTNGEIYSDLSVGYPIYIFDTRVGTGLTTINQNENQTIGISTTFLDNIYYVHGIDTATGIITCNISKNTNITGIGTTGTTSNSVGKFSWGKISGFSRSSNPISIGLSGFNVRSGLSTYPTIQRRGYGLRNNGSLKKDLTT